jgi:hypothetical protein
VLSFLLDAELPSVKYRRVKFIFDLRYRPPPLLITTTHIIL